MSKNSIVIQGEVYVPHIELQQLEKDRYDMKNVIIPALREQVKVLKEVLILNNISLPKEIEHER